MRTNMKTLCFCALVTIAMVSAQIQETVATDDASSLIQGWSASDSIVLKASTGSATASNMPARDINCTGQNYYAYADIIPYPGAANEKNGTNGTMVPKVNLRGRVTIC